MGLGVPGTLIYRSDYKTATHGQDSVNEFLAVERIKYGAQMDTYARMVGGQGLGGARHARSVGAASVAAGCRAL